MFHAPLRIITFFCAAVACGALPLRAADLRTVRVSVLPIADVAPVYAAVKNRFFEAEGLDVELVPTLGGAAAIPALVSGSLDVAYNNVVSALLAKAQGLDTKIIAPGTSPLLGRSGLVVRSADGFKQATDLEGKVVAVNTLKNTMWLYVRAWLKANGADPAKMTYREVAFPQMADALRQKRVDAVYVVDPFQSDLLKEPSFSRLADPNEIQPDLLPGVYVASDKFIAQDGGETLRLFLKGMKRGNDWYNEHIDDDQVADLIADYSHASKNVVRTLAKGKGQSDINIDSIRKTADVMREQGLLAANFNADEAVFSTK